MGKYKSWIRINRKINRKDFGLNWNKALEASGIIVGKSKIKYRIRRN